MTQLGIVTYNIAEDWDLPTLLSRLEKLGYAGVELGTGHAHKVEVNLTGAQRDEVRKRFEDSPVHLAGLGSAFEYQSADPAIVRKNIEGTKEYVRLAHDVGSPGVKVRPNGIPRGANLDETLRQIGRALHEIGEDATGFGIEIRVEVHGAVTQEPKNFARILQYADHPNVHACWNSNPTDVESGSINATFALVASRVRERLGGRSTPHQRGRWDHSGRNRPLHFETLRYHDFAILSPPVAGIDILRAKMREHGIIRKIDFV